MLLSSEEERDGNVVIGLSVAKVITGKAHLPGC